MAELLQGGLEVRRHADGLVEILRAPEIAYVALEFLLAADPAVVTAHGGRELTFAGQVTYRVTGWDDLQACLILQKTGGH
ncbi:hypothetical protein [Prauserella muralis]|uniref:Uncharacterized protein n=1 Tax=Prauserella muralis TaxID=588067 RepID=A0A2V4ANB0_9PSEU|nr:hypothetical protein [Prauserella muralis]PXY21129.1 hypothetical protein BAY60_27060 [Prauserella muralis]TWE30217.1 hypothetical protein FHX69_2914 [Prauserella muralis]